MVYSGLIHSAPALVAAAISGVFYGSYAEAFEAEEVYSLALLVFPFWSSYVSYAGVCAVFGVSGWHPRVWFLLLPCLFYLSVMGLIAVLFALLLGGHST
jgi:hypothetical protein